MGPRLGRDTRRWALVALAVCVLLLVMTRSATPAPQPTLAAWLDQFPVGAEAPPPPDPEADAAPRLADAGAADVAPVTDDAADQALGESDVAAPPAPPEPRPPWDLLRLVTKTSEPLPPSYVPPDLVALPAGASVPAGLPLRREAAAAFLAMADDAAVEGVRLVVVSGYRSYWTQASVYDANVRAIGWYEASRESAVPGRSEHQLGLALDISTPRIGYQLDDVLAATPEGRWLASHAWRYGFVLSYPDGKEHITGYRFEPWHYRYFGPSFAAFMAGAGRTTTEVLAEYQTIGRDPVR